MSEPDVLVVGGGLGGVMGALSAAEADESADVRLVVPRERPFAAHTGLVDVLGYTDGTDGPVARPLDALPALPDAHPVGRVGGDALERGLSLFDRATAGSYAGAHSATNALVPTGLGEVRPAMRYPATVEPGLVSRSGSTTLVGFDHLPDFDAFHAVSRLESLGVPSDLDAIQVSLDLDPGDEPPALHLARVLDDDAKVDRGIPVRQSVVRSVRAQLADADRIGFPAVLGLDRPAAVHADIDAGVEGDVFEIPLGSPSVTGLRLQSRLFAAVEDAGVTLDRELDVRGFDASDGRIDRVELDEGDRSSVVSPDAVVLATGGPAAGGIVADRSGVREPRFGCHVPHPDDRREWTEPSFLDDHDLATFGVRIDDQARPRTAEAGPVFDNLYAAGRVVGGRDVVAEHGVSGVALATGAAAGLAATQ
jgi:glycerol-3-phosphate dehydrogenase subunit B